jgi:adenine-specific DNA-methyltransferase
MARKAKPAAGKGVEALRHQEAKRRNILTAEYQSVIQKEADQPLRVAYERRNRDLDPQLVWRGKDEQDWSDLVVQAPPLYIQEKVHPKALIDDLLRQSRERREEAGEETPDLFADFNGIPQGVDRTEFYQHDQNWSNRMILGDSLQVMASLAEREGLRGKVQHDQPGCEGRERGAHHAGARAGEGVPRHVARWDSQLSDVSAGPSHGPARAIGRIGVDFRSDRR